jgi:hypothetical protein
MISIRERVISGWAFTLAGFVITIAGAAGVLSLPVRERLSTGVWGSLAGTSKANADYATSMTAVALFGACVFLGGFISLVRTENVACGDFPC